MMDRTLDPWEAKAHRVIADMCAAAWRQANRRKDGRRYAKPRPYTAPAVAQALTRCLDRNDEEGAKAIFGHIADGSIPQEYQ